MSLDRVPAGKDVPNDCNVVIEIPMRADPIKYEVDKETGAVFVDRFMSTAMHYPCNYGYIPQTLSDDGDPCDVLVLSPVPLITGVVVRCRPIGMLKMDDEAGGDAKILAVPIDKLSSLYRDVQVAARPARRSRRSRSRTSSSTTRTSSRASGCASASWVEAEDARREIVESVARFRSRRARRNDAARRSPRAAGRLRDLRRRPSGSTSTSIHGFLTRSYWSTGIPRETVERALAELAQLRAVPARRADRLRALRDRPRDVRVPRRRVRAARRIAGRASRRGSSARR